MKKLKFQLTCLVSAAFFLILFGLIRGNTKWLHRKPIICFPASAFVSKSSSNILIPYKEVCVTHILRPYAKKQGSVILEISIALKDNRTLFYQTIFWMAKDLGTDRFSDVPGDFTTLFLQTFNRYGLSTTKITDTSFGWKSINSSPLEFLKLCNNMPVLLNELHFSKTCKTNQELLWQSIFKSEVLKRRIEYRPIQELAIDAFTRNPLLLIGVLPLPIILSYLFRLILQLKSFNNNSKTGLFHGMVFYKLISIKIFILKYRKYSWVALIVGSSLLLSLILSRTRFLAPVNISCTFYQLKLDNNRKYRQSFLDYSSINVCIEEIILPLDEWLGIVNAVVSVYDKTGKSIRTDAVFFIKDDVNFSDTSGDIMYQEIQYYDNNGLLLDNTKETTSEQYENILSTSASRALWQNVKDKSSKIKNTIYLSPFRKIYIVIVNSFPYMFAGTLLIYSFRLSLPLFISKDPD